MAHICIVLYSLQKCLVGAYRLNLYFVASTRVRTLHIFSRKNIDLNNHPSPRLPLCEEMAGGDAKEEADGEVNRSL